MKKYLFLAAALTVMGCGMTSCSNDAEDVIEQNEQTPKVTKLVFTVSQDAETRALWSGNTPVFDDGDEVSLFSTNNDNVKLTASVSGGTVTLTGEGTADTELYFVYPYADDVHMDMGTKKITSTTAPAYNIGKVSFYYACSTIGENKYPENALSFAKSTDGGSSALSFKGLMAIIKYTTSTETDRHVEITNYGNSDKPFKGGQLTINASGATPTIESSANDVGICFPGYGVQTFTFSVGETYYMALPPTGAISGSASYHKIQVGGISLQNLSDGFSFEAGKIYTVTKP